MKVNTKSTQSLNKMAEKSRTVRTKFEPQWYLNLSFYLGDQWVFWNKGRLDKPIIPEHRLLITENRIMPVVLTRLAKKTKQRPVWTVVPNSGDGADINAAELGEQIMEGMWNVLCMQEKLFEVLEWADICSAGFWKICWDSTAGDNVEIVIDQEGKPMQDADGRVIRKDQVPQGMPGVKTKSISQGQVCLEVRSPFEILPDPGGKSIETCEWIIEEVVQSEDYVRSHHGVELEGDTEFSSGPTDSRFFPSWSASSTSDYKGVKVRELWMRKCAQFPKGRHTVWAKNQILRDEDNPYDGLPYVMFRGVSVPGRFWPTSIVEQLREPQIELNKIKSQVRENAQRLGNVSLLRDRAANVQYSGVPGEDVLWDSTMGSEGKPEFMQPPSMPVYVVDEIERIEGSIREIAGQHEVSNANVPAGVTAASAINLLLEQDDTRLGPVITELESVLGYSGQMALKLVAEYYQEERMIRLVGEDTSYDFLSFKGEQLKGNTQVEVQAGSQFPASKAAKQAAIQNTLTLMIQNGQPLDPRVMRKVLRDYQVGGLEAFFMDVAKDEAQTNREHRLLYGGQPLPTNTFDNDEIHVANHEDEMKSNKFFTSNAQTQAVWISHVGLHKARMSQQSTDARQAQMSHQKDELVAGTQASDHELAVQAHIQAQEDERNAFYKLQQIREQNKRPMGGGNGGSSSSKSRGGSN